MKKEVIRKLKAKPQTKHISAAQAKKLHDIAAREVENILDADIDLAEKNARVDAAVLCRGYYNVQRKKKV